MKTVSAVQKWFEENRCKFHEDDWQAAKNYFELFIYPVMNKNPELFDVNVVEAKHVASGRTPIEMEVRYRPHVGKAWVVTATTTFESWNR